MRVLHWLSKSTTLRKYYYPTRALIYSCFDL
eukprot:SAG31_NODE_1256_length_9081_cov_13.160655_9_plen_30_part_01